jgi:hypothetical protein
VACEAVSIANILIDRHIFISQTILILNSKDGLYETIIKCKFSSRCDPLHMQVRTLHSAGEATKYK